MQRWINNIWYGSNPIKWLLVPLSGLFWLISSLRRKKFAGSPSASEALGVPVIIVGNITVGGSGKTPMVIYLIELLRRQGYRPGVISRGYGVKIDGVKLVEAQASAVDVGDEPAMIVARTQVPMAVGPDRLAAVSLLQRHYDIDVIISDDGLQHYKLTRDIELVIIDGARRFGNGYLLPAGPLREGLWRLKTIDWLINNGGKAQDNEVLMQLEPKPLLKVKSSQPGLESLDKALPVVAMAGIGNPARFFDSLSGQGYQLKHTLAFDDHQAFDAQALIALAGDLPLIMTEKDAIKCRDFAQDNWWYLPVNARLNADFDKALLARLAPLVQIKP
ncbi:lipid-A-disaccharide synthase [Shewanella denitrificans OS217]|jgi:tetraacyldisaccharide 4'-kinase|uniref:Tetraacyldisaccharide 4'-kinase n=1 Tax=Shewanella denitrificans (strain OS217 / ATCC BAA-1090 / DSM 15013) TaxID=318161 RepID=LPXK_SHEDO|nr:tetraacyldisaccharide 4'-kinase [Shewanella denitrificans]Q12M47.1 RecName: Full=Tetraacyldisaccharide 4'-kinase; AltName: Full=Lipid A 4'-kinase [Shewanella denitrificans OS217]ABE55479.1 lipid-A-disaccharide synthase [Shewanella denitrificans OS217]